jgi:hypothetical protein
MFLIFVKQMSDTETYDWLNLIRLELWNGTVFAVSVLYSEDPLVIIMFFISFSNILIVL